MRKDFSISSDHTGAYTHAHARPVMVWRVGANGRLKASWKLDDADGLPERSNVIPFIGDGIFPFAGMQARAWHNRS